MKGSIFNIQRYSTHDGPGIRTVVFFCGCPLRCKWCQNPESQPPHPVLMQQKELCVGCGKCSEVCLNNAVIMESSHSVINRDNCRNCGDCASVCPTESLKLSGYIADSEDVMKTVLKDRIYYQDSNGGVTFSGGEATTQPEFLLDLLKKCRDKHIHTALETCGFANAEVFDSIIPYVNLFLYDLKTIDEKKHIAGTGVRNRIILENAKKLVSLNASVKFRMPLIPGFNDDAASVCAVRDYVKDGLGCQPSSLELLKYNTLGEVKYDRLGKEAEIVAKPQDEQYLEYLRGLLI